MKNRKWILLLIAVVIIFLLVLITRVYLNKPDPGKSNNVIVNTDSLINSSKQSGFVETQMRNIDFHIDEGIILQIKTLRGRLIPVNKNPHPVFNNKDSYILEIYSASVKMDMKSLSTLLNRYVFGSKGSAVKDIQISTTGQQLKQEGLLRGFHFTILSDVSVTPEGKIKLHPANIKVLGIAVGGLMNLLHLEVKDMIASNPSAGLEVIDNDLYLDPALMLPPPHITGHLKSVEVGNGEITQVFFSKSAPSLKPVIEKTNYMYFRGGFLTFGKLTMRDTDMEIMDEDPKDPFDFFNDHYFEQLVAGYHRTTPKDGLLIYMPDYAKMKK